MGEIITVRIEPETLRQIAIIGKEKEADRSTLIRELIRKGLKELLKENAAKLYIEGKVTISEAASLAGLTIWEMEKYLIDKGFKSDYSIDDLERELKAIKK